MTSDYVPIACDQHSILELLAMHRRQVELEFEPLPGTVEAASGRVLDVLTRDGAEYLVMQLSLGETRSIRLDQVLKIRDATDQIYARQ